MTEYEQCTAVSWRAILTNAVFDSIVFSCELVAVINDESPVENVDDTAD